MFSLKVTGTVECSQDFMNPEDDREPYRWSLDYKGSTTINEGDGPLVSCQSWATDKCERRVRVPSPVTRNGPF